MQRTLAKPARHPRMKVVAAARSKIAAYGRAAARKVPSKAALTGRGLLLLDQIFFSAANFGLTITLARAYSDSAFAAFGVAVSVALIVQLAQRNVYILRYALLTPRTGRRYLPGILAEHLIFLGVLVFVVGASLGTMHAMSVSGFPLYVVVSILACCLVYFQAEFDRAVQIKRGSTLGAFVLSFLYFIVIALLAALAFWAQMSFEVFMITLGAFAIAKGLWFAIFVVRPRWKWGWRFLMEDLRQNGVSGTLNAAISAGITHVPVMILASVSSATSVAGFIAMRGLTQPFNLIIRSLDAADKNRFRTASGGRISGARRFFWRLFVLYGTVPLGAIAIISANPDFLVRLAYGDKYQGLTELLYGWCFFFVLLGLFNPLWSIVRLFGKDNEFMAWNAASGVVGTAVALVACGPLGARGAMLAILCGMLLTVVGGLVTVRKIIFGSADGPLPSERRQAVSAPID